MQLIQQEVREDFHPNGFDFLIEGLLALLLCFAAFAFGATQAWSEEVTLALCGVSLLVLSLKLAVDRNTQFVWSWVYVPMALFIGLILLQSIVLPARLIGILSPQAMALRSRLLATPIGSTTLTLYPLATLHELRLPVCAGAVFLIVLNVYQRRDQVIRLLATIAVIGSGIMLLALYQNTTGSRLIYGSVPAMHPNSGPFMNHGHYAQFTNISLGATLALFLYQIERKLVGSELNLGNLRALFARGSSWSIWLLGSQLIVGAITVLLSLSRMGTISLIAAGVVTAILLVARGRAGGSGTLFLILAIIGFGGLLFVGFDSVFDRLATFRHIEVAQGGRWEILRDIGRIWQQFPLVGTGLGTHEFVFPMFDRSTTAALRTFAEDEFAQLLEETGLLGVAIFVFFLSMILWKLGRLIWKPVHRLDFVAYGLFFGIFAALIHSFSDFGQHVPAIAFLTAAECALVLVLSRIGEIQPSAPKGLIQTAASSRPLSLIIPRWAAVIAVTFALFFALTHADRARAAQAREDAVLATDAWSPETQAKVDLAMEQSILDEARQAAAMEPSNVSFQLHLADCAWETIVKRSQDSNKQQLNLTLESVDTVRGIVDQLKSARQDCPTFGPLYSFAGQLEKFALKNPAGDSDILVGFELAPYDPNVCFIAGQLEASANHWDQALIRMHRAVDLSDACRVRVIDALSLQFQRPDLAIPFATGHRDLLIHLADTLADQDQFHALSDQLRAQSFTLLQTQCQAADASPADLTELAGVDLNAKDFDDAVHLYRRALDQDYGQVDWRLKLAGALAASDHPADAIHEARVCLQLRPTLKAAEDLIAQLSLRPGASIDR